MGLTKVVTIRFSEKDFELFNELKKVKIKPHRFIRAAFREKINKDLKKLIEKEKYYNSKDYCPF